MKTTYKALIMNIKNILVLVTFGIMIDMIMLIAIW